MGGSISSRWRPYSQWKRDSTVKIWRKDNGFIVQNLQHPIGITTLCYSPDGAWIANASTDKTVQLWKTRTPE